MSERRKPYPFDEIEPKWQALWEEGRLFHAPNPGEPGFDPGRPKFYVLDMFPYPSGAGLHVGHPEGYTATDIVARYRRVRGFNVLHPIGWDAFGLPAEQYAIRTGQHPEITTRENIARFKKQLKRIGFSYDWEREISTADPHFYRWTQWIFLQIYNSWFNPETKKAEPIATYRGNEPDSVRLAYVAEVPVNWCPELGTVLANEEVIDGKSEVGGFPVVRRPMRQWMLRITAYAQRLIDELEPLDWPEGIKLLQRNWIGRSDGAEIAFPVAALCDPGDGDGKQSTAVTDPRYTIRVFTTRPDTLYGATYMVLAPENPLVDRLTTNEQGPAVEAYKARVAAKSDLERTDLAKEKSGVFTGTWAINPASGKPIPIWIADYVLMSYGTGAIMGVPAHDERDLEFARKFGLEILEVVRPAGAQEPTGYTGEGVAMNSPLIEGLPTPEAKERITNWLAEKGLGRRTVQYKLRDWLFSRQRYWGEPFPIIWENGKHRSLGEEELPIVPPPLEDYKPTGTGEPPLAKAREWVRYSERARRELNTMPQWAGSCWYYVRFCDPHNEERFVGAEAERYWMNVDLYVGGTEHAVLHLLYARFWHKVLFDLGHLMTNEPFQRLVNQGIILGEDGRKMSKRWNNVIDPLDVIAEYGADAFRCYEMFMGPLEQMKPWSTAGVEGVARFLARVWRLIMEENQAGEWVLASGLQETEPSRAQLRVIHATIRKVTEDIETLSFNTALAEMMKFVNAFTTAEVRPVLAMRTLLVLLNPFAPHLASELWEKLSARFPVSPAEITEQPWPEHKPQFLVEDEVEIVLQVNGKVRGHVTVPLSATSEELEKLARENDRVREFTSGKTIRKVVVIPKKLVNVVAN